jgi:hypothetical protein
MTSVTKMWVLFLALTLAWLGAGCGDNADDANTGDDGTAVATTGSGPAEELPTQAVPYAPELEEAGFMPVYYKPFPPALSGHLGRMILYRSSTGGKDGGMVYVEELGPKFDWVWHWYFADASPKSLERVEINKDGMWDIRVHTTDGKQIEIIQDADFILSGGARDDKIALNGSCSEPLEGHPMWQAFDGSDRTAWQSSFAGGGKPFIEILVPLGLADGNLSLTLLPTNQPKEIEIKADGKKVQTIELKAGDRSHLIQLDPAVKKAKRIRLEIKSCHGGSGTAAIAEISLN